jgi:hypothetical protein
MFSIEYKTIKYFMGDQEDYVYEIKGNLAQDDGEKQKHLNVGKINAYYINEQANREIPIHDIYDAQSDKIYRFFDILFDRNTEEIMKEIEEEFGNSIVSSNILVIDRLEVPKKYQGNNYGLVLLYNTIQVFGEASCSYVVLQTFPLQFEHNPQIKDTFKKNEQEAIKKLQVYYGKLGFKPIKNTPYMIYNTSLRQPKLELDWETDKIKII